VHSIRTLYADEPEGDDDIQQSNDDSDGLGIDELLNNNPEINYTPGTG